MDKRALGRTVALSANKGWNKNIKKLGNIFGPADRKY
jgi:hypothetical protein